jgi:hypothetical protein
MSRPPLATWPEPQLGPDRHPGIDPRAKKRKRRYQEALEEPTRPEYTGTGYRMPREMVELE